MLSHSIWEKWRLRWRHHSWHLRSHKRGRLHHMLIRGRHTHHWIASKLLRSHHHLWWWHVLRINSWHRGRLLHIHKLRSWSIFKALLLFRSFCDTCWSILLFFMILFFIVVFPKRINLWCIILPILIGQFVFHICKISLWTCFA